MTLFLIGILVWTLVEYLSHRFLHEWPVWSHLCGHHKTPSDYSIGPSWSFVVMFTLGLFLVSAYYDALGFALGYTAAYAFYARVHYLCHSYPRRFFGVPRALLRNHNIHHWKDDTKNFGVSSPLWDIVFRTFKRKP